MFIGIVPIGAWAVLCGGKALWLARRARAATAQPAEQPEPAAAG